MQNKKIHSRSPFSMRFLSVCAVCTVMCPMGSSSVQFSSFSSVAWSMVELTVFVTITPIWFCSESDRAVCNQSHSSAIYNSRFIFKNFVLPYFLFHFHHLLFFRRMKETIMGCIISQCIEISRLLRR